MRKNAYFTTLRIVGLVGALTVIAMLLFSSLKQKTVYENNVLFVLDLSYSMNAKDIGCGTLDCGTAGKVSRLEAAKNIITQVLAAGDSANYGLVIFSQSATQYVPLTADTGTFLDYLKDVNTGLLPGGGTDRNSLQKIFSGDEGQYAKIIFLSDAETQDKVPTFKTLKKSDIYLIGVGTQKGGNPTLPNGTVMKMNGKNIISSFDVGTASTIRETLHAKSFQIENVNAIKDMVHQIISSSPSFSYGEIQILVVVLGVFILLAL